MLRNEIHQHMSFAASKAMYIIANHCLELVGYISVNFSMSVDTFLNCNLGTMIMISMIRMYTYLKPNGCRPESIHMS